MLDDPWAKLLPAYIGTLPACGRHMIWLADVAGDRIPLHAMMGVSLATRWGETSEYSRAAALAILTHAAGRGAALALMDRFVRDVLAPLDPHSAWRYPVAEVRGWLDAQRLVRR